MKLLHVARNGKKTNFTNVAMNYSWLGDKSQVARTLRCSVLSSSLDKQIRSISMDEGEVIILYDDDGNELFRGFIMRKQRSLSGFAVEYTAYDGLIYVKRSKISRNFKKTTAEAITRTVCAELGVQVGNLASTGGHSQSFAAINKPGYNAILEAYTNASKITGKKYIPVMKQNKVHVIEKGKTIAKTRLTASTNIEDATYTGSIEDIVNVVKIVDDKGNYIGTISNDVSKEAYGTFQEIYRKEKDVDSRKAAQSLLKDIERTATVSALGGDEYDQITGNAIYIREAQTGLTGLFFIDGDEHTFAEGQHKINLTLQFQNMMDEV